MIKLTNIKIRYGENTIITDGNIELNPGDLCLITGDSGSGKSSLLKVLSLNMQSVTNYYFNDVNLYEANETIISEMKKNKIAYVTQNNMLFKDLTVLDNLEFFSEMGYGCINSHLIEDLGSRLNISKIFKKKAAKLSGGEKQRVAIACAVLKNAELYLFDEPTSMVDIDNKRIINDIFNELSTKGKIVVIVSHEPIFINHNIEYSIEGKNLVSKKNNCKVIEKTSNINPINKQSNKSIREFSLKTMLSHPIINAIYVFIFGISIAMITSIIGASIGNINYQSSMIDLVNCPELFVINTGEIGGSSSSDDEILPEMSDELVTEISALENVVSVNRFIYFPLHPFTTTKDENIQALTNYAKVSDITLISSENQKIISFNYFTEFCKEEEQKMYAIYPTYSHQQIESQCSSVYDSQDGIYISKKIADKLGISDLNGEKINITFGVPIAEQPAYLELGTYTGKGRNMFVALGNQTFTIKGILQYDIDYYSYQISYHPDFFLDIESIEKIQFDYWKEYEDYLVSLENTESSDEYMQQYFDNVLESSSIWESSALVVQVNDEKNINQVMKDITRLDSLLHIVITDYGISLADTNLNANVIRTAFLYSSVIYGVLLFAMIIIMFYRKEKRKEIEDLLIINGFTQSELNSINMFERKIEIIVVTIISVMLSIVFFMSLNQLLYYEVQFTLGYVIFIFTAIILVILASEITTKNITKRRKEEKE